MVVAGERQTDRPDFEILEAVVIPETPEDAITRWQAAQFIGAVLAGQVAQLQTLESDPSLRPIESLKDAIHLAVEGDETARKMVAINVRTDMIERTIKTGHVISVELQTDKSGRIIQHDQAMESVQANSLLYAAGSWQMMERTKAETNNAFRIQEAYKNGELEDNYFVVISRAADNMSDEDMDDVGFFTSTMSCAIQLTDAEGTVVTTESAFVSGIARPGETRHDADTVIALGDRFSIDLRGKTAAEILDTPFMVPKYVLPNGAIDVVRLYDEPNSTFFGEAKPQQDYLAYRQSCDEREKTFEARIEAVTNELIASSQTIRTRLDAVHALNKLSEEHAVEHAVYDTSIDARVFGSVAAPHIEEARLQRQLGNIEQSLASVSVAKQTAESRSCPSGPGAKNGESADTDGDCEYVSKTCPLCEKKNVRTKVSKRDPLTKKRRISGSCGCSVVR